MTCSYLKSLVVVPKDARTLGPVIFTEVSLRANTSPRDHRHIRILPTRISGIPLSSDQGTRHVHIYIYIHLYISLSIYIYIKIYRYIQTGRSHGRVHAASDCWLYILQSIKLTLLH